MAGEFLNAALPKRTCHRNRGRFRLTSRTDPIFYSYKYFKMGRGFPDAALDTCWWEAATERAGLRGLFAEFCLNSVLDKLASTAERQLVFDMSLVGFDRLYAQM